MEDRYTLRRVGLEEIGRRERPADDPACEATARSIMDEVRGGGEAALARLAGELDGNDGRLWYGPDDFEAALEALPEGERAALGRAAGRVRAFAEAQLASLGALEIAVPGGRAGHEVLPVERAGCYVPGGRYPLPSTVLMTALVAKTAGVADVVVACPRPAPVVLAACALAGADALLAAGGAQAIAAFAYGAGPMSARDVIVGPGNRYVAAAKRLAQAIVRTDAPAGPSELLVLADASADPSTVAWDLLAQAEHDPDAVPALAVTTEPVLEAVERALAACLEELAGYRPESAIIARAALANGWTFVSPDRAALAEAANRFAPEHLELALSEPRAMAAACRHAGAVFLGRASAEAFGDYGAGPNHTLPTSGRSRSSGGLSALDFVRIRTWLELDAADPGLVADTAVIARAEGLFAHAKSAEARS
jgi:phosphoribosyl-ATP pyrophosphohydrolase/phosphoribosyl-AMP cyclohydrolase/histidinol dehydrogenase